MPIDPRHNVSDERDLVIMRDVKLIRRIGKFQRGSRVPMRIYEADRMRGAFVVNIPFTDTVLPLLLVYPVKPRLCPEIYLQHESFQGFAPLLDEVVNYDPARNPLSTVFVIIELLRKATAFQLARLQEHICADADVKSTFKELFETMDGDLELLVTPTEVKWSVYIKSFIPKSSLDSGPVAGGAFLTGATSLGNLAETTFLMQFNGKFAKFYKEMDLKFSLPPFDSKQERLLQYVKKVGDLLQMTAKVAYHSTTASENDAIRFYNHEVEECLANARYYGDLKDPSA